MRESGTERPKASVGPEIAANSTASRRACDSLEIRLGITSPVAPLLPRITAPCFMLPRPRVSAPGAGLATDRSLGVGRLAAGSDPLQSNNSEKLTGIQDLSALPSAPVGSSTCLLRLYRARGVLDFPSPNSCRKMLVCSVRCKGRWHLVLLLALIASGLAHASAEVRQSVRAATGASAQAPNMLLRGNTDPIGGRRPLVFPGAGTAGSVLHLRGGAAGGEAGMQVAIPGQVKHPRALRMNQNA